MTGPKNPPPPLRLTAYVIWGALVVGVLLFAAVAAFVGPGLRRGISPLPEALPLGALVLSIVLLAASRFVPGAMRGARTTPLARNIVALGLGEAGALLGVVAWMLTGSGYALAAVGIGLAAMLACFPGDARWRVLGGESASGRAPSDRSGGPGFGARGRQ